MWLIYDMIRYDTGTLDWLNWVEFNAPPDNTDVVISEAVSTANHLTVTDKQTIRKKLNINHKNTHTHINTMQIKENKQLNIQQKQNYPDSVTSYDTEPGNEVGLFYNGPRPPHGPTVLLRYDTISDVSHIMHYINLLTYLFLFLHVVSKAFNYIVLSSCNIVAQMLHWSLSNGRLLSSDHLLSILNCYSSVLCNSQLVTLLSDRESTSFVCSAAAAVHAFVCSRELCTTL